MPTSPTNPAFPYLLEFVQDDTTPSDASVYIQMRDNPPIYMVHTNKEDYDILPPDQQNPFITTLFDIAGVTEMSIKAYRIWIMKSPAYNWSEVLLPILYYLSNFFGYNGITEMAGSGHPDGTGLTLDSVDNRRAI